jgi:hypothetical protein
VRTSPSRMSASSERSSRATAGGRLGVAGRTGNPASEADHKRATQPQGFIAASNERRACKVSRARARTTRTRLSSWRHSRGRSPARRPYGGARRSAPTHPRPPAPPEAARGQPRRHPERPALGGRGAGLLHLLRLEKQVLTRRLPRAPGDTGASRKDSLPTFGPHASGWDATSRPGRAHFAPPSIGAFASGCARPARRRHDPGRGRAALQEVPSSSSQESFGAGLTRLATSFSSGAA